MKLLVKRYVTAEQRKRDDYGITEDDVMEIRQDISSMRYELIDIFQNNGMKTPNVKKADSRDFILFLFLEICCRFWSFFFFFIFFLTVAGKKGRVMERRILKDFQIGFVETMMADAIKSDGKADVFSSIAKIVGKKSVKK